MLSVKRNLKKKRMKTLTALLLLLSFGSAVSQQIKIDTESSTVKWVGNKATGQHNGTIAIQEGTLDMDGVKLTGGSFSIDMTSITCEDLPGRAKTKLETHLKSDDFFAVENHPTASFIITKARVASKGEYVITGNITIKDITKEIQFSATVSKTGNRVSATADLTIDRSEFNVRYGSGSFFDDLGDRLIYDDFELSVFLVSE